ncbi:Pr6Pr family membrane protein [Pseudoroseicyclus tamaricis]|uniref:Uncharacterized protein n=1 Tax=Pseudoroseicyclus tamaricis TaxID=2705421 RepID=A0A6B2K3G0_9RHOB|nr:Pr6Pr family membrane protein [Pseudoroseicyclus tamaricis]NDV02332.1 hypothetical protein [Pseudoroseicyclus tamaricis]
MTNWLVTASFLWMAATGCGLGRLWPAGLVLWTAILGLVFFTLLGGGAATEGIGWWIARGHHAVIPVAVALWWLGFAPKTGLAWRAALVWLGWPALYVAIAMVWGFASGFWPYGFINAPELGWAGSIRNIVVFFVAFWLGGLVLVALAKGLGRWERDGAVG